MPLDIKCKEVWSTAGCGAQALSGGWLAGRHSGADVGVISRVVEAGEHGFSSFRLERAPVVLVMRRLSAQAWHLRVGFHGCCCTLPLPALLQSRDLGSQRFASATFC